MPNFTSTIWPGMIIPGPAAVTGNGGIATAPALSNLVEPTPTTEDINWTSPAAEPVITEYVNPTTTTDEIRTYFNLQPPLQIPPLLNP